MLYGLFKRLSVGAVSSSLAIIFLLYQFYTYSQEMHIPKARGDYTKYATIANDIYKGEVSSYTFSYMPKGYAMYILGIHKIFKPKVLSSENFIQNYSILTYKSFYVLWCLAVLIVWLSFFLRNSVALANISTLALLVYLYLDRVNYTNSLLSENLYIPLVLIALSIVPFWLKEAKVWLLIVIGLLLGFSNEIRPFSIIGIGLPFLAYLVFKSYKNLRPNKFANCAIFFISLFFSKLLFMLIIAVQFSGEIPKTNPILHIVFRVTSLDGTVYPENGPTSKYFLDINSTFNVEKSLTVGAITNDKETYEYVLKENGVNETARLYKTLALETLYQYPWITIRNTGLNLLSFVVNHDLTYLYPRRIDPLLVLINPIEWQQPLVVLSQAAKNLIYYPQTFLLLLLLIYYIKVREFDIMFYLLFCFMLTHVWMTSLFEAYLYRYAWPVILVSSPFLTEIIWMLLARLRKSVRVNKVIEFLGG